MELKEHSNLILRITEYGLKHKSFIYNDLVKELKLGSEEEIFLHGHTSQQSFTTDNPNHLLVLVSKNNTGNWHNCTYALTPSAFYNYIDYLEIKEARRQAEEAKKQSELAIRLSTFAIIITIALGLGDLIFRAIELYFKR